MANSNGIITRPDVNTTDVKTVLSESTYNEGALCVSLKIKKWPKFKPVRYDTTDPITDAQRKSVNYGIANIPYFNLGANMASFMRGAGATPVNGVKTEYFAYEPPTGSWPKRIGDFAKSNTLGYWHGAEAPIFPPTSSEIKVPASASSNVDILFSIGVDSEMAIRLCDIDLTQTVGSFNAASWYVGVCLTNSSKTAAVTQSTPMSQVMSYGAVWHVPKSTFTSLIPDGTYTAFAFLTNCKMESMQAFPSSQSYLFIPLTFASKSMTVKTESVNLLLTIAGWRSSTVTRNIDYSLSVTNKSSGTVTVTKIAVKVYKGATLLSEITPTVSPGFTLNANQSHTKSGSVDVSTASNRLQATLIRMEVTVNGQIYASEANITASQPQV